MTGIDPVESSIAIAEQHAGSDPAIAGRISYRCCSIEELLTEPDVAFDCVVVSEVVEHVSEKELFIQQLSQLLKVFKNMYNTGINDNKIFGGILT